MRYIICINKSVFHNFFVYIFEKVLTNENIYGIFKVTEVKRPDYEKEDNADAEL